MNLLFISAQLNPLCGETPLGHQVAHLGGALSALGHRVTAIAPLCVPEMVDRYSLARRLSPLVLSFPEEEVPVHIYNGKLPSGVEARLLGHESLFEDPERLPLSAATLCRAALQLAAEEGQGPWHILHAFGLSGALSPLLVKGVDPDDGALSGVKTVLTVEDLEQRGRCDSKWVDRLGLSWDDFTPDGFEFYGELDLLKAGLVSADHLVFSGHSNLGDFCAEGGGNGLEGLLRSRSHDSAALLPGLDFARWNPATDAVIPVRFDAVQRAGKISCKAHLQNKLGLPVRPEATIFGLIPPLLELAKPLSGVLERLLRAEVQLIAPDDDSLDPALRELSAELKEKHPRQFARCPFDEEHQHLLLGGADFVVLDAPEDGAYEPLLAALRYGALPVTQAKGLARDLVVDLDGPLDSGNGLLIRDLDGLEVLATLQRACAAIRSGEPFQSTLDRAMAVRCSWEDRARQLEQIYAELLPISEPPKKGTDDTDDGDDTAEETTESVEAAPTE